MNKFPKDIENIIWDYKKDLEPSIIKIMGIYIGDMVNTFGVIYDIFEISKITIDYLERSGLNYKYQIHHVDEKYYINLYARKLTKYSCNRKYAFYLDIKKSLKYNDLSMKVPSWKIHPQLIMS